MLTLYGDNFWISPYVFTCYVALKEKRVPFSVEIVHLETKQQHEPAFRNASITGKVPALKHERSGQPAFWLAESSAICEYLEDEFPAPAHPRVLPADVRERARARQIMAWIRSDLMPLREERSTATMFYEHAKTPLSAAGRDAAAKLVRVAEAVIPEGHTQLFAAWSLADADLAFMLHRLILNGHEIPARVRAFAEAQWQRPSVREFVERERAPYVPY